MSYESLEGLGDLAAVDSLIAETIAYFAALDQRLRSHGLVPDEVETVMVGEATRLCMDVDLPGGVAVRRVDHLRDRDTATSAHRQIR